MSLYNAIKHLYPDISDNDFLLYNDGTGEVILRWDSELPLPPADVLNAVEKEQELATTKKAKNEELNNACNLAILEGFTHEINGQVYWFSYDNEAQGNFRDGRDILKDGILTEVPWTVRIGGINGEYTRIPVTLELMNELTLKIMEHKMSKIGKYRDFLMPLVSGATTPEEVAEVVW